MKRKILATTFLFILLCAGCNRDPILGKWKPITQTTSPIQKALEIGNPPEREFLSDGTFNSGGLKGTWRRLGDGRLEMQTNLAANLGASPSIETVTIEDDVATFTSSNGTVSKWKRQGLW